MNESDRLIVLKTWFYLPAFSHANLQVSTVVTFLQLRHRKILSRSWSISSRSYIGTGNGQMRSVIVRPLIRKSPYNDNLRKQSWKHLHIFSRRIIAVKKNQQTGWNDGKVQTKCLLYMYYIRILEIIVAFDSYMEECPFFLSLVLLSC